MHLRNGTDREDFPSHIHEGFEADDARLDCWGMDTGLGFHFALHGDLLLCFLQLDQDDFHSIQVFISCRLLINNPPI